MALESVIGRVLWKASREADFRKRFIQNPSGSLAEEGFILSDEEMMTLRSHWEGWQGLEDRLAASRIAALARSRYRE